MCRNLCVQNYACLHAMCMLHDMMLHDLRLICFIAVCFGLHTNWHITICGGDFCCANCFSWIAAACVCCVAVLLIRSLRTLTLGLSIGVHSFVAHCVCVLHTLIRLLSIDVHCFVTHWVCVLHYLFWLYVIAVCVLLVAHYYCALHFFHSDLLSLRLFICFSIVAHCHCALHDLLSLRLYNSCHGYWHDRDHHSRDSLSGLPTMVRFDYLFSECLHDDMSNYPFVQEFYHSRICIL